MYRCTLWCVCSSHGPFSLLTRPSTSPSAPLSVLEVHPREIQTLWSQNEDRYTTILHTVNRNAVKRVNNAMPAPLSVLEVHPREIQTLWSQNDDRGTTRLHTVNRNAVKRVNAMPCNRTRYVSHNMVDCECCGCCSGVVLEWEMKCCWTYSHHGQIADMKPSKGSWNGEFRGFRICVGWISTTRFCVVGFYVPFNFCVYSVSIL